MSNLVVKRVESKKDLNDFVTFPWKVYKGDPYWVPPLISEVKDLLGDKNPFWQHAERELFLLKDSDEVVGRVAGIVDHSYKKIQNEDAGFFGFFETYDNSEYTKMLLDEVRSWLKSKKISKMYGPMNPSTNDEMGFLFAGFEDSPKLMMPYNPKYYLDLMEGYGLSKAKDLYAYIMDMENAPFERLKRFSDIAYKKNNNVLVRSFNTKKLKEETFNALGVYNEAWEHNWGFVPWTKDEFFDTAKKLKALLFKGTTLFVEVDSEVVGMIIAIPDYNEVMKRINGKLSLLGIIKFLWYKRKIKGLRVMILGVKKDFRKKGLEGLLFYEASKNAYKAGFKHCEFSWILEDNTMSNRACEMMGGKVYKKYRVYEMDVY